MSIFRIRRAGEEDVPALVDLMEAFYAESHYPLDRAWAAQAFRVLLAQPALGAVFVADGGGLLGHAVLTVRYAMDTGGLAATIDDLFVLRDHRRHGIARALLQALVDESTTRGCASLHVEVGAGNAAANALYSAFGLQPYTDDRIALHRPLP